VPFIASIPADALNASGLVAAVTAGLVTGNGLARYLRPQDRIADEQNWRTIELLLEGGIFLLMGLEVHGLVDDLRETGGSVARAALIGAAIAATVILVRAAHATALLLGLGAQARRKARAAASHLMSRPFTGRERLVIIWAGMRGAVTVAAAQTLPEDTPQRATLILVAFVVAAGTLLLQGGHAPVVDQGSRRRRPGPGELQDAKEQQFELRLAVIDMERRPLLAARKHGAYSSRTLREVLAALDAEQTTIELKGGVPARLGNALDTSAR
jgi:NhaP-type Na+/H+ or K+/H+ antiporter